MAACKTCWIKLICQNFTLYMIAQKFLKELFGDILVKFLNLITQVYSEPYQRSNMELLVKIANSFLPLTIFARSSILDVWQGSEYASRWRLLSTCWRDVSLVFNPYRNNNDNKYLFIKRRKYTKSIVKKTNKIRRKRHWCWLLNVPNVG